MKYKIVSVSMSPRDFGKDLNVSESEFRKGNIIL